jgi:subtilisin family serine protease/subtilisin-like proprotein convertase family protein
VKRFLRIGLGLLVLATHMLARAAVIDSLELREPGLHTYRPLGSDSGSSTLWPVLESGSGRRIEFGNRLLIRTVAPGDLESVLVQLARPVTRRVDDRSAVISFDTARDTVQSAAVLSRDPRIEAASPSRRRFNAVLHSQWGAAPNDPYFPQQWHLEPSRSAAGAPARSSGLELRSAWPASKGASIIISIVDDGVDSTHPDLQAAFVPALARNWFTLATNSAHTTIRKFHGTAVAGLAAARGDNAIGITGTAPLARVTGWVIFDSVNNLPETENLAQAFEYQTDVVPIQNHSWGNADLDFLEPTLVERIAMSNAVTQGRGRLGTVYVRSAGNTRYRSYFGRRGVGDANLDGFANLPGAITVAGLRRDGSVASYSAPGACLLVAAPGGEVSEGSQLFTLDPVGDAGNNRIASAGRELADYLYGSRSAAGTSFATPIITGLTALALDTQPGLSLPDLHRILALASWPIDLTDPDLATNRAGLLFSHNVGYGTPDPGILLDLARRPVFRLPPATRQSVRRLQTHPVPIPDDGLRVVVTQPGGAPPLSFGASGGTGMHPDEPTAELRLVDAGVGSGSITAKVGGAAALLQRLPNEFDDKIRLAADAGARSVIIANSDAGNGRLVMLSTDFARIPAVLVGNTDGATLRSIATNQPAATARLELTSAQIDFDVSEALSLDWVEVRVKIQHPRMGDLRITLRSPGGTRSVLHRAGTLTNSMIGEWWYSSKRHLLEGSVGTWSLAVTDEASGMTGVVAETELILHGVPIVDTDADGLDDDWERRELGSLSPGGADDPDADGWSNAAEAFLGQSPQVSDRPLAAELFRVENARVRIAWPARSNRRYEVERAANPQGPWLPLGGSTFPGRTGSWFQPESTGTEFFRVIGQ